MAHAAVLLLCKSKKAKNGGIAAENAFFPRKAYKSKKHFFIR